MLRLTKRPKEGLKLRKIKMRYQNMSLAGFLLVKNRSQMFSCKIKLKNDIESELWLPEDFQVIEESRFFNWGYPTFDALFKESKIKVRTVNIFKIHYF